MVPTIIVATIAVLIILVIIAIITFVIIFTIDFTIPIVPETDKGQQRVGNRPREGTWRRS